ncbi:hypothetical protein CS912_27230 [Klebsiella variicola]|nr:hypothetical protein [Klebsiella variicola]PHZ94338.1 hypothetical protein CS911_03235 [Klebsiella variicola]PIA09260.1 hypothetical protein CS912_27230 [Klebsiella variicola]PXM57487.1 hypothetical protein DMS91_02600 [Klebsiella variicola]CTQ09063.1 hypothetical protein BN1200_370029 [Klebsiella variicola]
MNGIPAAGFRWPGGRISAAELFSYRVKFPGIVEITEEHLPKRQQQTASAKDLEITPFMS